MLIDVFSKEFIAGFVFSVVCVAAFPRQTISAIKTFVLSLFVKMLPGSSTETAKDKTEKLKNTQE